MKGKERIVLWRILLALLILANMTFIFMMSLESGTESGQTSGRLVRSVATLLVRDFEEMSPAEQETLVARWQYPIRKIAHMTEFGSLGALILALLLTWKGSLWRKYAASLAATFLYACSDEWHQSFSPDRGASFVDVLWDTGGAVIAGGLVCLFMLYMNQRKGDSSMKTTVYRVRSGGKCPRTRLAVVSDLHDTKWEAIAERLRAERPDMILIPGDLTDDIGLRDPENAGYGFLRAAAEIAPTYYSLGNHELACYHKGNPWRHPIPRPLDGEIRRRIADTGAVLLENDCVRAGDFTVCGLTSGINGHENKPDEQALAAFDAADGVRILLCHHPEYFVPYVQKTGIELTVCGHAHGGHWRFFGRGVYSPGQGLFPKYTSGVLDGRCVISRGIGNHTWIPRICNPTELVMIELEGDENQETNEKGE